MNNILSPVVDVLAPQKHMLCSVIVGFGLEFSRQPLFRLKRNKRTSAAWVTSVMCLETSLEPLHSEDLCKKQGWEIGYTPVSARKLIRRRGESIAGAGLVSITVLGAPVQLLATQVQVR